MSSLSSILRSSAVLLTRMESSRCQNIYTSHTPIYYQKVHKCLGRQPPSKWIDIQLQLVVHLCPVCLKDRWQLLHKLCDLTTLPSDATCYTANAVSMYTNINKSHGIAMIARWLELLHPDLPSGFSSIKILEGLDIIMCNNVFAFGSLYFKQCNCTAMTPCACTYATIYYS
jgi:hypothetical protein